MEYNDVVQYYENICYKEGCHSLLRKALNDNRIKMIKFRNYTFIKVETATEKYGKMVL